MKYLMVVEYKKSKHYIIASSKHMPILIDAECNVEIIEPLKQTRIPRAIIRSYTDFINKLESLETELMKINRKSGLFSQHEYLVAKAIIKRAQKVRAKNAT